jgi:hypothetical protein
MQANVTAPKLSSEVAAGFDRTIKCGRCTWLRLDVFTLQRWGVAIRDGRTDVQCCGAVVDG